MVLSLKSLGLGPHRILDSEKSSSVKLLEVLALSLTLPQKSLSLENSVSVLSWSGSQRSPGPGDGGLENNIDY